MVGPARGTPTRIKPQHERTGVVNLVTCVSVYTTDTHDSLYEESWREDSFIVGSNQQSKACKKHAGRRARSRWPLRYMSHTELRHRSAGRRRGAPHISPPTPREPRKTPHPVRVPPEKLKEKIVVTGV